MNYDEQTNAELSSLIEDLGIDVEAKNPKKPNKAELVAALNKYDGVDPEAEEAIEEPQEVQKKAKSAKQTKKAQYKEQYNKMMKLMRVNVTSNSQSQTKPMPNQVLPVSWGNRVLGYHTDRLILGKPWHIRYGALLNLKNSVTTISVQNDEKNRVDTQVIPSYNIIELKSLTKPELDKMAKRQIIRDESLEALSDD